MIAIQSTKCAESKIQKGHPNSLRERRMEDGDLTPELTDSSRITTCKSAHSPSICSKSLKNFPTQGTDIISLPLVIREGSSQLCSDDLLKLFSTGG